jgi:hypothetical protein
VMSLSSEGVHPVTEHLLFEQTLLILYVSAV